jgi:hypothetical protein
MTGGRLLCGGPRQPLLRTSGLVVWCGVRHVGSNEEVRGAGVRNERHASYVGGDVRGGGMIEAQWKDDLRPAKRTPAGSWGT